MQIKNLKVGKLLTVMTVISVMILFSCTEKYWPELNSDYEHLITIDGKITNEPGPYTIRLLTSSAIDTNQFNPLSGARIFIIDKDGSSELLIEKENGEYQTDPNGIQGIVGHEYKITIDVNGKSYESSFEELQSPVGVESLSAEWIRRSGASASQDEYGFQFYLTTETANQAINYFYWELKETYRYQSRYRTYYIYYNHSIGFVPPEDTDTVKNCWKTNLVDERFTYTTKNLSEPKVNKLAINFTPNSDKFEFKYALQAKQYNISENAYIFLSSLEKQNDIENSLYTTQPFQILGNVYNIDDLDEPVLGYFITAGVSVSQPVMVKRAKSFSVPIQWGICDNELTDYNEDDVLNRVMGMSSSLWPIFVAANPFAGNEPGPPTGPFGDTLAPMIIDEECVDCRVRRGGVNIKPVYWDDNSLLITFEDIIK